VFFVLPLIYLIGGLSHGQRGPSQATIAGELQRCSVDVTDWPQDKVDRLLQDIRHADEVIEQEHEIQRHHRERPSLELVQERKAVADLSAYRQRRAEVSTVRRPARQDNDAA
jgi:hypothetical protein